MSPCRTNKQPNKDRASQLSWNSANGSWKLRFAMKRRIFALSMSPLRHYWANAGHLLFMTLDANVHVMSRARPHHPNLPDPMFYPLSLLHWIHTRKEEKNIYWYKIIKIILDSCETERLDLIEVFCVAHVEKPFATQFWQLATGNW